MSVPKRSFAAMARAAWADDPPDWVIVLADEVDRTSQVAVAKRIGYSSGVVSSTLNASYRADMRSVEHAVRGALMGATVTCPVLDEIARDQCLEEQRLANGGAGASAMRMQLARACKTCPHSRLRADK